MRACGALWGGDRGSSQSLEWLDKVAGTLCAELLQTYERVADDMHREKDDDDGQLEDFFRAD